MTTKQQEPITFRSISDNEEDLEFLFSVYASTREEELAPTGWPADEIETFLRMQFKLQHEQYTTNNPTAAFEIILVSDTAVGRLYVNRTEKDIRVMDIALLTDCRRKGIGGRIFTNLLKESDRTSLPLSLHVEMNNPILDYYNRLGFEKKGDVGVYYYMERAPMSSTNQPQ